MRKRSIPVFLTLTLASAGTLGIARLHASEQTATADAPTAQAGDPVRARLAALAGRWTVRQTLWTASDKPPAVDEGTAVFTIVLAGHHLRQELRVDSATPFEGLGYIGYDEAMGRYDSVWMDVNFGGVILAHGDYAPARATYTFVGAVPDPAKRGGTMPLREVMHVADADHVTYDYYETHGDKEALAVRLEYTRVK